MIEIAKFNNEIFTEKEKQQDTEGNALLINLSIHLTQLLVTSDLKRQIEAFTAASARCSKRVS